MADYDFTACLSPLDFELLSKDLLEAELGIQLENFSEGRDKGIDLRYAPLRGNGSTIFNLLNLGVHQKPPELIVQCKRYSEFSDLKSTLKNKELAKIQKLQPARYILTTSVSLAIILRPLRRWRLAKHPWVQQEYARINIELNTATRAIV